MSLSHPPVSVRRVYVGGDIDGCLPRHPVMAYYRVKKFIPLAARHWINYAAVRSRLRDAFPQLAMHEKPRWWTFGIDG